MQPKYGYLVSVTKRLKPYSEESVRIYYLSTAQQYANRYDKRIHTVQIFPLNAEVPIRGSILDVTA